SACPSLVAAATRSAMASLTPSVASSGRAGSMRWTVSSAILADSINDYLFEYKDESGVTPGDWPMCWPIPADRISAGLAVHQVADIQRSYGHPCAGPQKFLGVWGSGHG